MTGNTVSSHLRVSGIHDDDDVREALQSLFDIFSAQGLGQATFEITGQGAADLWVKHAQDVTPDLEAIDAALRRAGDFHLVQD